MFLPHRFLITRLCWRVFPAKCLAWQGRRGFADDRGMTFLNWRVLHEKLPQAFMLENVKNLLRHNQGKTFAMILEKTPRFTLCSYLCLVIWQIFGGWCIEESGFIWQGFIRIQFPTMPSLPYPLLLELSPEQEISQKPQSLTNTASQQNSEQDINAVNLNTKRKVMALGIRCLIRIVDILIPFPLATTKTAMKYSSNKQERPLVSSPLEKLLDSKVFLKGFRLL